MLIPRLLQENPDLDYVGHRNLGVFKFYITNSKVLLQGPNMVVFMGAWESRSCPPTEPSPSLLGASGGLRGRGQEDLMEAPRKGCGHRRLVLLAHMESFGD